MAAVRAQVRDQCNNTSSTVGIVYNGGGGGDAGEQLVLLRTMQDNERNIIAGNPLQPKGNVSVISSLALDKGPGLSAAAYDPSRLKKHGKNGQPPPVAVAKRNARERNRVKQVNNGFATLRQHIPSYVAQGFGGGDRGKKLSKVETLRMAVEYIRDLQRTLAEADGAHPAASLPSPTGSLYSSSLHNGSADELARLDERRLAGLEDEGAGETRAYDDDDDEVDDDEDEVALDERPPQDRRRLARRFRPPHSSLAAEKQPRERCRRRENCQHYKQACVGDEENIEPPGSRNNNNSHNVNHNNNNSVLVGFSPILGLHGASAGIKREVQQQLLLDQDDSRRSSEDDSGASGGVLLAASSPYAGEIFIESPETGRLVPLKVEEHEDASGAAQLVYVSAEPAAYYYKSELPAELSWWGESDCVLQQIQPPSSRPSLTHA